MTTTTGSFEVDWEFTIMWEIENKMFKRADVAQTYSYLLRKSGVGWETINRAIMARWSESALIWIKTQAWRRLKKEEGWPS